MHAATLRYPPYERGPGSPVGIPASLGRRRYEGGGGGGGGGGAAGGGGGGVGQAGRQPWQRGRRSMPRYIYMYIHICIYIYYI